MASLDVLYLISTVAIAVVTVTVVWLANELIQLIKSLRRSAEDTATVTAEFKKRVLLMSEALDRVGTAASHMIGLIEDAEVELRGRREKVAQGIGLVMGAGDHARKKREKEKKEKEEMVEKPPEEEKKEKKEEATEKEDVEDKKEEKE